MAVESAKGSQQMLRNLANEFLFMVQEEEIDYLEIVLPRPKGD